MLRVFIEENRMQIDKATAFNRKSGEMWDFTDPTSNSAMLGYFLEGR